MRALSTLVIVLAFGLAQDHAFADPVSAPSDRDPLLEKVDRAIQITSQRALTTNQHTPWQIMHGLLARRENYELNTGHGMVNAIDWISNGAQYKGEYWFEKTKFGGRAHPYNGTMYDYEGHVNQFLAILAMSNLPLDHQFRTAQGTVTMQDMIDHAKMMVNSGEEITWTLWFLTHYLDPDSEWTNQWGQHWSIATLVRWQVNDTVYNSPCGGTHGLFALSYARNSYLQKHGHLRGVWIEADQKIQQYIAAAQALQNRDGTFPPKFFKSRGISYDFNERLKSTGHITEFLMMALSKKRLNEQWVRLAVQAIANDLMSNSTQPAECGPLYHSLHALILYRQRVGAGPLPTAPADALAQSQSRAPWRGHVSPAG